jgi:outer membrane protein OmpA-like peptidoglycan-associated protein
MQLIDGRTPEQWRTFDRWKLIVALALAASLVVMWMAGMGPGRAAECCTIPGVGAVHAPPPVAPPETAPPGAPSPTVSTAEPAPEAEARTGAAAAPETDCPQPSEVGIGFASANAELSAANREVLDELAPCLGRGRYEVAGHADSSGTPAINDPLAEARARAVVDHLTERGVDAERLRARGYGSKRPLADNATSEGRARNRRVEIRPR